MATKMITRTLQVYTYTCARLDLATMSLSDRHDFSFPYKLGAREEKKLEKTCGAPIVARSSEEKIYGMPLELFAYHAVVLDAAGNVVGASRATLDDLVRSKAAEEAAAQPSTEDAAK